VLWLHKSRAKHIHNATLKNPSAAVGRPPTALPPIVSLPACAMSSSTRKRLGSAASSLATKVDKVATGDRRSYTGTAKDASHAAFYTGLAKGFACGMDGVVLFLSQPALRQRMKDALASTLNVQLAYVALAAAAVILLREPAETPAQLFWALSRWARILTLLATLFLDRKTRATEAMFLDALAARAPPFGAAVRATAPPTAPTRERLRKYARVAKLAALRGAGAAVARWLPGGRFVALPALRYIALRPTLGGPGAAAVAAVHALPASVLALGHFDDVLVSVSEAVMDAEDMGFDAVRGYVRRLDGAEAKEYFRERYRGYVTGMGALYSVLQAVPFLGVPVVLVAQCGGACCVVDVVTRNLGKEKRRPLCGEEALLDDGAAAIQ
jgi:hypothetical protein